MPFWAHRAADPLASSPVIWDYHVILIEERAAASAYVWDLDRCRKTQRATAACMSAVFKGLAAPKTLTAILLCSVLQMPCSFEAYASTTLCAHLALPEEYQRQAALTALNCLQCCSRIERLSCIFRLGRCKAVYVNHTSDFLCCASIQLQLLSLQTPVPWTCWLRCFADTSSGRKSMPKESAADGSYLNVVPRCALVLQAISCSAC